MRKLLLIVGLLALVCSPTMAGKNTGGALVVHTDDATNTNYTFDPQYCEVFESLDPGTCENCNSTSTVVDPNGLFGTLIYVLAAFPEGSNPGVSQISFGLAHNLLPGFVEGGVCGPPDTIEAPDSGWLDDWQSAGNLIVFGSPVVGDILFMFYWLGAYGDFGNYIGTGINPTDGYAGFLSDDDPAVLDECTRFGQVRWFEPGYNECPEVPVPIDYSSWGRIRADYR